VTDGRTRKGRERCWFIYPATPDGLVAVRCFGTRTWHEQSAFDHAFRVSRVHRTIVFAPTKAVPSHSDAAPPADISSSEVTRYRRAADAQSGPAGGITLPPEIPHLGAFVPLARSRFRGA
jgi:hypothetical protein